MLKDFPRSKQANGKTKQIMQTGNMDMHRYMYVRGNPVKYTDPGGHEPISIFVGIATLGLISSGLSLADGGATQPPWHNYTGQGRKSDDFSAAPVTLLDSIAMLHDWFNVVPFQTANRPHTELMGDAIFIASVAAAYFSGAFIWANVGFGFSAVWQDLSQNCNGKSMCYIGAALGTLIFGPLLGLFFAGTDIMIGGLGVLIFSWNMAYNAGRIIVNAAKDSIDNPGGAIIGATIGGILGGPCGAILGAGISASGFEKPSTKNFWNMKEWKAPEGKGVFNNWNRPSAWCFNPFGC